MKNFLNKFVKQFKDYMKNLSKSQKIKLSIIVGVSLISVVLLIVITTRPNYVTLYSNLSETDAGAITTKLKGDLKVPYKLANGGTTILVPSKYRDEARMQLATQGLPQNGFSIDDAFKNSSLGTTDLERQKRYYYFLQSEIASAIKTLNGVKDAQVLIVVPDDNSFVLSNTTSDATAAVKVVLNPGVTLNKSQIDGIIQFVSKSVQQLKPQNITLIDSNGAILNGAGADSADNISSVSDQYDLKSEIESRIKDNVESLLEQIYGPGNVVVRVNANLNFDTQKENSVQYTPIVDTNGIVRSIQNIKETQDTSAANGQTPGISNNGGSNTNSTYVQGSQNNPGNSNKTQQTVNYEINEIQKEIEKAKGSIDKLSVAVVINNTLTSSTRQQVAKLVSSATGTNTTDVTVDSMKFDKSLLNAMNSMNKKRGLPLNFLYYGIGLMVLLAGGTAAVLAVRNKNKEKSIPQVELVEPVEEEDTNKLMEKLDEKTKNRVELENLIKEKPDVVAQLIKTLMQQD